MGDPASLTTTDKTSAVAAINELDAEVGTLSTLTTTVQSTLVGAINELDGDLTTLDAALDALDALIGELSDLDTTDKSSIVDAINEVLAAVSTAANLNSLAGTLSISKGGTGQTTASSVVAGSSKVSVTGGSNKVFGGGNVTVDVNESSLTLQNLSGTLTVAKGGTGANQLGSVVAGDSIISISNGTNKVIGSNVTLAIVTSNITSLGTLTSLTVGGTAQIDGNVTLNSATPPNAPSLSVASVSSNGHLTPKIYVDNVAQSRATTEVEFDSEWIPAPLASGSAGAFTLAHGMSSVPDFLFTWIETLGTYGSGFNGGSRLISPQMDAVDQNYHTGYLNYNATNITTRKHSSTSHYACNRALFGDVNTDAPFLSQDRYIAVNKTADYDSGWFAVSSVASTSYVKAHNLGVFPSLVIVELADTDDPNTQTWRVPKMGCVTRGSSRAQCHMVSLDSNNLTIQTGTSYLAEFVGPTGSAVQPTSGFCRVQVFNWTPDYDSGWLAISTTAGDRDKILKHGLNRVPSIASLMITNAVPASSPGTQVLNCLGNYMYTGSPPAQGTILYSLTKNFAYVKGGSSRLTNFINATGTETTLTTGCSYRLMLWR